MAGIGFRLQALVTKGSYLEASTAYASSAVISAGPWLAGVVALMALSNTTFGYLPRADHALLFATILSVFAASILVTGGPQMLLTRYLADRFYLKDIASVAPTCTGMLFLIVPFSLIALPFLLFAPFELRYRLLVITLFLILSLIWMIMICLSAAHEHKRIVLIFVGCYAFGVIASIVLGPRYGLLGSLAGFTLGQVLCLSLLLVSIYLEFPSTEGISFTYLRYISKYWDLLVIGAVYTVGIWIDSIIFWLSSHSQVIHGFYHLYPPYDTAKLVAYLSTIPASVIFMVHLETNFHRHYQSFYLSIQNKKTLSDLVRAREGMRAAIRAGTGIILKVQGLLALFLCLIAQDLAVFVGLASRWVPLLCMDIFAGIAQFFVFLMMLLLLYLDRRGVTLFLVGVFAFCNGALTLVSLYLGDAFYGMGYLAASLVGAILGWFLLDARLKQLEYLTFMKGTQKQGKESFQG